VPTSPVLAPGAPHLLVIGGGIAGASAAYFAAQVGWRVTLIDAAHGRASEVPGALLDPLRGSTGQADARALAGLQLSWALIAALSAQGHHIPHEQLGVLRPQASDLARRKIEANLPVGLPHQWLTPSRPFLSPAPSWLSADDWPHLLLLPQGGWVAGGSLVAALTLASGAEVRQARAASWDAGSVTLEGSEQLHGQAVLCCGGSVGAGWMNTGGPQPDASAAPQMHRGGSVLLLGHPPAQLPVSAGIYLAPAQGKGGSPAGVLGATFETPSPQPNLGGPPPKSLDWLLGKAAALWKDPSPDVIGLWSGSRLTGERVGRQAGGWWTLSGLGSKGFLLGPLLAQELVGQIVSAHKGPRAG
jgi:glycine/D-amino acid oxidase-like deaminating enzyme